MVKIPGFLCNNLYIAMHVKIPVCHPALPSTLVYPKLEMTVLLEYFEYKCM